MKGLTSLPVPLLGLTSRWNDCCGAFPPPAGRILASLILPAALFFFFFTRVVVFDRRKGLDDGIARSSPSFSAGIVPFTPPLFSRSCLTGRSFSARPVATGGRRHAVSQLTRKAPTPRPRSNFEGRNGREEGKKRSSVKHQRA